MLNSQSNAAFTPRSTRSFSLSREEARVCARDGCTNPLVDVWEETETLCGRCALETELFDRDSRRERFFANA
jgi:hypothetical protein